ncbi:hypothetical protein [Glutamicibacter sp.]|uniref:hypothetical protein n=1 Tax=Glutamicibacter sp. TaxID=1931995 RepID=UPI003D6A1E91
MVQANPEPFGDKPPQAAPARYARGWHCLGLSHRFRDGSSRSLSAFGSQLAVQANGQDQLMVRLESGTVEQELPSLEQDGLLYAWHDPQGAEPAQNVSIPRLRGGICAQDGEDLEFSEWAWKETTLAAGTSQVMEHLVHLADSPHVTRSEQLYFKNVFEGQLATQYFEGPLHHSYQLQDPAVNAPAIQLADSVASYYGPAVMIAQLDYVLEDRSLDAVVLTAHYPIDAQHLVLMTGVMVRTGQPPVPELQAAASGHAAQILRSITGAVRAQLDGAAATKHQDAIGDHHPLAALHRWYAQFFVDTQDITPGMTERYEYEVDTTMPMDLWTRSSARTLILRRTNGKQLAS